MGQSSFLTLVNGTQYIWKVGTYQEFGGYQSIQPGAVLGVTIEWNQGDGNGTNSTVYDASCILEDTGGIAVAFFQIKAEVVPKAVQGVVSVYLGDITTQGNPMLTTIELGSALEGHMAFVLSGNISSGFVSTHLPSSWMQNNIGVLGAMTMRQLCMPGSHDAGMYTIGAATAFADACNTRTQTNSIFGQLVLGSRYFDIRPVITGGTYATGHYSYVKFGIGTWQGANGETIAQIIADVNLYTSNHKELVILNLSHDLNTDVGSMSYRPFTQDEWNTLFTQLADPQQGLQNLYLAPDPTEGLNLTKLTLGDFINPDNVPRAAVIVIVDPSGDNIKLGDFHNQGFYYAGQYSVYNSYLDTNNFDLMAQDQISKMRAQRTSPDSKCFLLSWTLSLQGAENWPCSKSILDLAQTANPQLYPDLLPYCTQACYPNILYIDNIIGEGVLIDEIIGEIIGQVIGADAHASNIAALAMAINYLYLFTLNPVPAITSISPREVLPGGSGFTLTVNGSGFVSSSVINVPAGTNPGPRPTTVVSSSQLTVHITAHDIAHNTTIGISVTNPTPGGGTSSSVMLLVE